VKTNPSISFIEGHVGSNGDVFVTSKHKCYKGKWYYAAKKKLAALKANKSIGKSDREEYDLAYDKGYNAALDVVSEYCADIER